MNKMNLNFTNNLKSILDTLRLSIISIDINKFLTFYNSEAKKIFSLSKLFIGKPISGIIRNPQILDFIEESLNSIELHNESKIFEKDFYVNASQPFDVRITFLKIQTSNVPSYLIVFYDISSIIQSQKAQAEFVENVSHELKTPITSILAAAETIPSEIPFRDVILRQSQRMDQIIEDLLQISMLENNNFIDLNMEIIDLKDLILSSIGDVGYLANKKNINIIAPKNINCCNLEANQSLMENVLSNILRNAIMYSDPNSRINIILSSNKKSCVIEIIDNGKGIKKENLNNIFNRFYREESSRSRDFGGSGLGLPIVKKIIDLHKVDKGTTVKLFLPLQTQS